MAIKKSDLKLLRYIYRHKSASRRSVMKKFRDFQGSNHYTHVSCYTTEDKDGFSIEHPSPDDPVTLTEAGILEVESHQFFNLEYVLSSLVLPVIVGVLSSVITALILLFLG